MFYYKKYKKYKLKYITLKGGILNKTPIKEITLYHGSPFKMDKLIENTPRGHTEFNRQTGVYFTSDLMEAMLYSMARDKERKNGGWGITRIKNEPYLTLLKDKWNTENLNKINTENLNKLNEIGYVHIYKTTEYEQNPDYKYEYIVKHDVIPDKIIEVRYDDIKDNIIYIDRNEINKYRP